MTTEKKKIGNETKEARERKMFNGLTGNEIKEQFTELMKIHNQPKEYFLQSMLSNVQEEISCGFTEQAIAKLNQVKFILDQV